MKEITLTEEELNEIKDTIKFRTKVCLHLKQLNGIPKKVIILGVHIGFQWFFLAGIIAFILWKKWG